MPHLYWVGHRACGIFREYAAYWFDLESLLSVDSIYLGLCHSRDFVEANLALFCHTIYCIHLVSIFSQCAIYVDGFTRLSTRRWSWCAVMV